MKRLFLTIFALLALMGCSYGTTRISSQFEASRFQPRPRFRINDKVLNDKGENITQEIINNNLEEWQLFTEIREKVRYVMEDDDEGKNYICVNDPYEEVSFVVDIGFSAFYQKRVSEDDLWRLPNATLLPGCDKEDTKVHYLRISMLAPLPGLEGFAELWKGEIVLEDDNPNISVPSLLMIEEVLKSFPAAHR